VLPLALTLTWSSSSVHSSLFTEGLTWLCHLVRGYLQGWQRARVRVRMGMFTEGLAWSAQLALPH
jgi:hypothetical protein